MKPTFPCHPGSIRPFHLVPKVCTVPGFPRVRTLPAFHALLPIRTIRPVLYAASAFAALVFLAGSNPFLALGSAPPPGSASPSDQPTHAAAALSATEFSTATLPLYRCPHVARVSADSVPMDPTAAPWNEAPVARRFYLCDAKTPAALKTDARMVWDDQALYALFVCEDPNIWSHYTRDQAPLFNEEVVELFLDPQGKGRDYFEFEVSPLNKRFAAEIHNNGKIPPKFRPARRLDPGGLTTRVVVDGTVNNPNDTDKRWTVLIKVPFAYLDRSTPKPGEVWRGNLYRIDRDNPDGSPDEFSCWSPTHSPRPNFHISRYFGKIEFEGVAAKQ